MTRRSLIAIGVLLGWGGPFQSVAFQLVPSQVEIAVAPAFNHTPVRVGISNAAGLNLGTLRVSSDAGWVTPSVDTSNATIVLNFATANLVASSYTATISAASGTETNSMFVRAYVAPLSVFKLKDDPLRSRTYGVQQSGLGLGSVIVLDPVTTNHIGNVTVGRKPSDLAVSANGQELFVINCVDETISVIDLVTLTLKETLALPAFDNWGVNDTTANVGVGPGNILYYTDGAWAPALRVLDRSTMQVTQTHWIDGNGFGDFGVTSDKSLLFGWAQYGWSAGWAGSYIARFTIAANGQLTFTTKTDGNWPTVLQRDPLETPISISSDNQTVFVKQHAVDADSLALQHGFPTPVYSITPGGEVGVTDTAIYETETGLKLADLPRVAPVQTISSDYSRLIYFDSATRTVKVLNLVELIGPGILNRDVVPADGSITLSPPRLEWRPMPGVDAYHVYLGTSETAVTSANTNSPLFLGTVNQPSFTLATALTPGTKYFWRVDAVTAFDVAKGDVREFTVSVISSSTNEINGVTVRGHADFKVSFQLNSQSPGIAWSAAGNQSWVSFLQSTGSTPGSLTVVLNASQLSNGLHRADVTISSGGTALFSIPVKFRVEPINLTIVKSDPASVFVYAISEDPATAPTRAYLLEINSLTESIRRVVQVGSSATDLALHKGDNRIYVPNWLTGSLLAIDLTTFRQVRAYPFSPFGGVGYSENDIYRVSAGVAGRLIWEEQDQWIDINIFDTVGGTNIASAFVREGGGSYDPTGRYYYHGDNNSSGAEIHKFDTTGDRFTELAAVRVASVSYYGSRTVVVSEDGSRIFWNGSAFNANLAEEWTIGDEVFSTSANGRYAFSRTKVYNIDQRRAVLGMPANTAVSAFNSTTHKLVVQVGDAIRFFQITDPLTLPAPILSTGQVTHTSVVLNWIDSSLEDDFTLQRRTAGSATWQDIATIGQNVTSYTVSGLNPETTYDFRIKANAATVSSDWSSILSVTTPAVPPTTPSLNVPVATLTSVTLSWSNPSYETEIILERSISNSVNWSVLATLPAETTTYIDSDVVSLRTHYYRVKARNAAGESPYSTVRSVTIPAPSPPSTPSGFMARSISNATILLSWNDVSSEAGYRLERRNENPASWALLASLPANTTNYHDTNVVLGMQYWYRVLAFNSNGNSQYSIEATVIPTRIVNLIQDDFDPDADPLVWADITGGVATNGGQGFRGSKALFFSEAGQRSATTIPLDVSFGGTLEFWLRGGNEAVDGPLWNNSESGEGLVLEFAKDGVNWTTMQGQWTSLPQSWARMTLSIPPNAYGATTQFRWRQLAHSGPGFDVWAIEDLVLQGPAPASPDPVPFVISSPSSCTSIAVFWIPGSGASSYVVERRQGGQAWAPIATVPATYYTDSALIPETAYTYRIQAVNAGGSAAYSPTTTTVTWSQVEQWSYDNFGTPDSISPAVMTSPLADGTLPLLRYAFNLGLDEPARYVHPGENSGFPLIWLDSVRNRLCVEFVRRKAAMHPGVNYHVQFSSDLANWTNSGVEVSRTPLDALWERVRYEDTLTRSETAPRFGKIGVSLP